MKCVALRGTYIGSLKWGNGGREMKQHWVLAQWDFNHPLIRATGLIFVAVASPLFAGYTQPLLPPLKIRKFYKPCTGKLGEGPGRSCEEKITTEARTDAPKDGTNTDGAGEDECSEDAQEEGANEDEICEDKVRKDAPEERTHACVVHEDESTADAQEEGANEDKICEDEVRTEVPEEGAHASSTKMNPPQTRKRKAPMRTRSANTNSTKTSRSHAAMLALSTKTSRARMRPCHQWKLFALPPDLHQQSAILSSEALAFFSTGRTGGRQPRPSTEPEDMDRSDTDNALAAGPNAVTATHQDNLLNRFKPRGFVPHDRPAKPHQFIAASTTKVKDGEDGYLSDDGSDYSITKVAAKKEKEHHNRLVRHQTFVPLTEDYEEQDERDTRAMEEEMVNRGRKRGKSGASRSRSSAKKAGPLRGEDSEDGKDGEGGDGSEDEETRQQQRNGLLSKEHREQLLAAYTEWQGFVTEMSKVTGKKESTLYKAVGQDPTLGRTVNSWNTFQAKFRVENRQPKTMSSANFTKQVRAAYKHLFEELPEDKRSDPVARRAIVKPIIDWYSEKTSVVMDARKEKGGSLAMLNKVVQPFIRQSTLAHQNNNVDIFGFGIDTYGDQAVIWGGSLNFLSVHDTYLPTIKVKLVDIKAMFQ
ncbi:hypothetical protein DFH07DRAFT_775959 [Mycena maculata]|uniref:Uncharacterized protein n=1 Tax=Mycena maculata TaxID=230809 RepID=A0AAD7IS11_9AGAR|nr:hypothetical protein DFH07DRAFT_775959 [Mycena maculata]